MAIVGNARLRSDSIVEQVAENVGCEPAVIDAIIKVEANGLSYDPARRLIIRPEAHKIASCPYLDAAERRRAALKGFTRQPSLPGYHKDAVRAGDKAWKWVDAMAREFGEEAAFYVTSFGAPQIMGFNFRVCGYEAPSQMVRAFADSEDAQFMAMGSFLIGNNLKEACRLRKWRQIARTYNGPKYEKNAYHIKLEQAYLGSPFFKETTVFVDDVIEYGDQGQLVEAIQERLRELGFHVDKDGDFGGETRDAVRSFQFRAGISVDGKVGPTTSAALKEASPKAPNAKPVAQIAKESATVQAGGATAAVGSVAGVVAVANAVAPKEPVPLPTITDVTDVIKVSESGVGLATKVLSIGLDKIVIALAIAAFIFGGITIYRRINAQRKRKFG